VALQALNNLSNEQVEYQVRDRLSFSRFLGRAIESPELLPLFAIASGRPSCHFA
jgi:Transposase domain (DUF772)